MKHSYLSCEYGSLFGLSSNNLSVEQLSQVIPAKLIEFISIDVRIDSILSTKVNKDFVASGAASVLADDNLYQFMPLTIKAYNEVIKNQRAEVLKDTSTGWYPKYRDIVKFNILTIENKLTELRCFLKNETTCFPNDFKLIAELLEYDSSLVEPAVQYCKPRGYDKLVSFILMLPDEEVLKRIPEILQMPREVRVRLLSFPKLPEEHHAALIKDIGGRIMNIPSVRIPLSKKLFSQFPPVTRLEIFETVLFHSCHPQLLTLTDIKTTSDLDELLFSASLVKNDRVRKVTERFGYFYKAPDQA